MLQSVYCLVAIQPSVCIILYIWLPLSHFIIITALPISGVECTAEGPGIASVVAAGHPTFFLINSKDVLGKIVPDFQDHFDVYSEGTSSYTCFLIALINCYN